MHPQLPGPGIYTCPPPHPWALLLKTKRLPRSFHSNRILLTQIFLTDCKEMLLWRQPPLWLELCSVICSSCILLELHVPLNRYKRKSRSLNVCCHSSSIFTHDILRRHERRQVHQSFKVLKEYCGITPLALLQIPFMTQGSNEASFALRRTPPPAAPGYASNTVDVNGTSVCKAVISINLSGLASICLVRYSQGKGSIHSHIDFSRSRNSY